MFWIVLGDISELKRAMLSLVVDWQRAVVADDEAGDMGCCCYRLEGYWKSLHNFGQCCFNTRREGNPMTQGEEYVYKQPCNWNRRLPTNSKNFPFMSLYYYNRNSSLDTIWGREMVFLFWYNEYKASPYMDSKKERQVSHHSWCTKYTKRSMKEKHFVINRNRNKFRNTIN